MTWQETCRIGEAQNPGPGELSVYTCNPTTMWNKQDLLMKLCPGVIGISETAATQPIQHQLTKWCYEKNLSIRWSAPVGVLGKSNAGFRGMAGGTAIMSSFPQRFSNLLIPEDIQYSNRFCESHILVSPHRYMYMASLYGPTVAFRYADHIVLMDRLFNHATERALCFRGPASIVGDLNTTLDKLSSWPALQRAGWIDAAVLSSQLNGHELDNTSCDTVRHSFILINQELARTLVSCRTTHKHMFATHPVLQAKFNMNWLCTPVQRWILPKSFDSYLADEELAIQSANQMVLETKRGWEEAFHAENVNELAKRWTNTAEAALAASATDATDYWK